MIGKVFLVGAGPGDPGLLTVRAAELIATADAIALDALVSDAITSRIPRRTEILLTGKRAGAHAMAQEEINALLIAEARKGKRVVRLKGGDPFVFGRGGEEAIALAAAGIPFEVVPGISSAIAGPARAGIPVTHRSCATSVTLVTAHEAEESTGIAWNALAASNGTLVFLMGLSHLSLVSRKLREHGMPAETAVAVISKATTPDQKTVTGTLDTIELAVANARLEAPALIVVGEVVRLRDAIAPERSES
jgi:uroporphyrinogen III methyltransferase/synthase